MSELTPEKLGEMTGYKKFPEHRTRRPEKQYVTNTVTAKGSPLTDPEGVKGGRYSYSETVGESMEDDNIMTKSISQCIAERQGTTPRGAFSKARPVDVPSNGTIEGAIGAAKQQKLDNADIERRSEKQGNLLKDMRTRTTMNDIGVGKPRLMVYIKHPDGTMEDITEKVPPTIIDLADLGKFEATTDYGSREPDDDVEDLLFPQMTPEEEKQAAHENEELMNELAEYDTPEPDERPNLLDLEEKRENS